MAPGGGGKRKRGDRTFSQDSGHDGSRPSPHRPGNLSLAQQSNAAHAQSQQGHGREQQEQRGGGRRRASRGGRGTGSQRSPMNSPNTLPLASRTSIPGKAQSPPATPTATRNDVESVPLPHSAPSTTTATTQTADPQQPPAPLYFFEYVTDEQLSQWDDGGRGAIVEVGVAARRDEDFLVLGSLFQELMKSGFDGRMDAEEAGITIKAILEVDLSQASTGDAESSTQSFDATSFFLDCLSIIAETSRVGPRWPPLLIATSISPMIMRHQLEAPLLESLGMIRSTFVRVGIRQQTNLLYRQSNYNLLREETEGYSKLITELFTTSSTDGASNSVTEETFERVKGMIGAFDLDVGRVLDVTLDVFAAVLVKHYRFFVKYLRASSWWPQGSHLQAARKSSLPKWALPSDVVPSSGRQDEDVSVARGERDQDFWRRAKQKGMGAFFELGDRAVDENELHVAMSDAGGDSADLDEDRQWIQSTGTLPPLGNQVAAQILGFKLRFYSSSARSPTDVLPVNLIYLAALLIKIGFISLRDLYPHLWPADDAMEAVKEEKLKEKAEKEKLNRPGAATSNALTSAGALSDDTMPPLRSREPDRLREVTGSRNSPAKTDATMEKADPAARTEDKEELPEPSDQKVQLLKSLLCIGAIPEALYILGRFPWIPDAFPELPEYIHRIAHHSLQKVYEPLRPMRDDGDLNEQRKEPDSDQAGVAKGHLKVTDGPPRKVLRWAQLDKEDTNEAVDYRFYWDDWADNVPICQSVDDVFTLCATLLNYSGVKIGQDPGLLLKLTRIGFHSLTNDDSEANRTRWVDLSKRLLVPALSMTKRLPGVVNEVYELISLFATTTRYSIYAEWYQGPTSRLPDMKAAFDQTRAETRDVLKRISKTNTTPMGRLLANSAHSSPGIVFEVALAQIESYDNMIESVVECCRCFTFLSYDVLTWSILRALGGPGRLRVQQDGMLTSKWLSALAHFTGRLYKRYSRHASVTPVLQYVAEQLRQSNTTDLVVLEQITASMAGIVTDTSFNEAQVLAMAGGELLQAQTMLQLFDKRHEAKTTAKRLLTKLTESRLAGQLLVLVAQERQTCVFKIPERNAYLKLLGNLFDELHRVFTQYLDLLRTNLSIQAFDDLVPSVSRLILEYGIEPNVAFAIARPSISAAMAAHDSTVPKGSPESKKAAVQEPTSVGIKPSPFPTNGEVKPEPDSAPSKEASAVSPGDQGVGPDTTEAMEIDAPQTVSAASDLVSAPATDLEPPKPRWHPVMKDIMDQIEPALPSETWGVLSRSFFVAFWSLSFYDLLVPSASYDEELNRKKKKITEINSDRQNISREATQAKEKEKKGIFDLQDRLRAEYKCHIQTYGNTRRRMIKEKDHWFADLALKKNALNTALLEQCFLPRIMLSPMDAMFAYRMYKFLHSTGAPNFWSMGFLDQIFGEKRLTSILFLCTSKEAEYLGRFLVEILRELSHWHADKANFEKEAYGAMKDLPGFVHKQENETLGFLSFEGFRSLLFKWHRQLHIALKACFAGGEYMHIRNAINVQKAVYQTFPAIDWMGQQLVKTITELSEKETREDLKLAARSLLGNLRRREKEWVMQNAFGAVPAKPNGANGQRSSSAKPSTPGVSGGKDLNPKAAEFRPTDRLSTDGATDSTARKASKTRVDAEDGEIQDAKMTDATIEARKSKTGHVKSVNGDETIVSPPTLPPKTPDMDGSSNTPTQSQAPKPASAEPTRHSTPSAAEQTKIRVDDLKPNIAATKANAPSIPPRPEVLKSASTAPALDGRSQHGLPSKPDASHSRSGESRMPDNTRNQRDHAREQRYPPRGGMDGTRDIAHQKATERSNPPPNPHSYERSDRLPNGDRERPVAGRASEKGPPGRLNSAEWQNGPLQGHESRPALRPERFDRSPRDRAAMEMGSNSRPFDPHAPSARDGLMGPPRSTLSQHPDRVALIHGNTDRITNQPQDRRQDSRRFDGPPVSERPSRPGSPGRSDDRRNPRFESGRDDRPPLDSRQQFPENIANGRLSRYEDGRPPSGPRTDRPVSGSQGSPQDRFRESPRHVSNPSPANEHHRRDQSTNHNSRQQESQYGRLNAGPEIPLGPRLPNGNSAPPTRISGRTVSAPHQINTQPAPGQTAEVVAAQTPTGPSSRGPPRNGPPMSRPDAASSAPPTPVADSPDTAGVHPDRLRAIQGASGAPAVTAAQGSMTRPPRDPMPPISVPPSPVQRQHNQMPSPGGPLPSPGLSVPGSIGPLPTSRGPPTGPSFGNDRARGDKRMFAGLQNTLQQAGTLNGPERSSQGTSIRGRGGRANNPPIPSPTTPGPPIPAAQPAPPDSFPRGGDLFANRPPPPPPPTQHNRNAEPENGRGARRAGGGEPFREPQRDNREAAREGPRERHPGKDEGRNEERRSGHHRSSRDHSRENGPAHLHPSRDEDRPPRHDDPRDRGRPPMPSPMERDSRRTPRMDDHRRAESDRRDMEGWDREGRNGMERRDDRDPRDGGGSGRKRGRGGEDGHNDSKRPRRSGPA